MKTVPPVPPALLIRRLREFRCTLFIGSGLSACAGLPLWKQLIELLVQYAKENVPGDPHLEELDPLVNQGKYLEVADYCKNRLGPARFQLFLKEHCRGVKEPIPEPHQIIARLRLNAMVTTNYDKLIERAFDASLQVATHADRDKLGVLEWNGDPFLLKAHGDIDRPETIVLTAEDYRELIHSNSAFADTFASILRKNTILFIGYSLADPDFRLLLDRQLTLYRASVPDRYALMQGLTSVERDVLWRSAHIQVLPYSDHREVPEFLRQLEAQVASTPVTVLPIVATPVAKENIPPPPVPVPPKPEPTGRSVPVASETPPAPAVCREAGLVTPNVVLIPGFLGSDLSLVEAGRDPSLVWCNMFRLVTGGIADLALGPNAKEIRPTGINLKAYTAALISLRQRCDARAFPYDWRLDLNTVADQLKVQIEAWFGAKPVCHFLAHSTGGLVVRTLMKRHPKFWEAMWKPASEEARLRGGRLIMLGTPNQGAVGFVRMLLGKEPALDKLAMLDVVHDLAEVVAIFRTFPSIYQQLPSPFVKPEFAALYEIATYGQAAPRKELLKLGRAHHELLEDAVDPERMFLILGDNQETDSSFQVAAPGEFRFSVARGGDGRVTHELARLRGVPTRYVEEAHGDLAANPSVLAAVEDILASGATSRLSASPARGGSPNPKRS